MPYDWRGFVSHDKASKPKTLRSNAPSEKSLCFSLHRLHRPNALTVNAKTPRSDTPMAYDQLSIGPKTKTVARR